MDTIKSAASTVASKLQSGVDSISGKRSLILVTGGTGFVAAHVLQSFLSRGYKVRTTVRSEAKAAAVKASHARYAANLETSVVEDITCPGAFDAAVSGVDGVIHTASPFVLSVQDNQRDLLDPAIKGTTSILESVHAHAPQVKRVVITSSFAAILDLAKGYWPEHTYTEADWNPLTLDEAVKGDGATAYCASKALAEKAAFDFQEQRRANFTVATICPPYVWGPLAHDADINSLNTSSAELYKFVNGTYKGQAIPPTGFPVYVDVRDVADAHLKAFEHTKASNERYFVIAGTMQYPQIAELLHKHFPERADVIPDPKSSPIAPTYKVDNSKSRKELGLEYISFEKCVLDSVKSILKLEGDAKAGRKSVYNSEEWE